MIFLNQRGNAVRSHSKNDRIGTHVPVLQFGLSLIEPITSVIEHGMGKSSTPFFHSLKNVNTILSFEDDKNWQVCDTCCNDKSKRHLITNFTSVNACTLFITQNVDPSNALALIDGPQAQRVTFIQILQELHVPLIIEHDVETLNKIDLQKRTDVSTHNSYTTLQYVKLNPESMLYTTLEAGYNSSEFVKVCG